jgi:hypothetical protein
MPDLGDHAISRTDAGLNGAFSAVTRAHKTIAFVRKLEVVHRLETHFQRLVHRARAKLLSRSARQRKNTVPRSAI